MAEELNHAWQQVDHQVVDGMELCVSYSPTKNAFRISVSKGGNSQEQEFNAVHEPRFGMDIEDQHTAYRLAEELAQKLEAGMNV